MCMIKAPACGGLFFVVGVNAGTDPPVTRSVDLKSSRIKIFAEGIELIPLYGHKQVVQLS